jgi:hypothetical protein
VAVLLVGLVVIGATSIVGLVTHVEHEPLIAVLGAEATLFASVLAFMRAILPPLVALVVASVVSTSACGSSAAAVLPVQTVPQHVSIDIDASDGGSVSIAGDVWLDARGGSAGSDAEQSGTEIEADVSTDVAVPISTGGGATTGPATR